MRKIRNLLVTTVLTIVAVLVIFGDAGDKPMQQRQSMFSLTIRVAAKLHHDAPAQAEFVKIAEGIHRQLQTENQNESTTYQQSEDTHRRAVDQLTAFAEKIPAASAALSAKMLSARLIADTVQGADMRDERREARRTAIRLMQEIRRDHGDSWEAQVSPVWIANFEFYNQIEGLPAGAGDKREKEARIAQIQSFEAALAVLPTKPTAGETSLMPFFKLDPNVRNPIRAQLLMAIAIAEYNLADLEGQSSDATRAALKRAKERFGSVATEFPESQYFTHCRHMISVMIDPKLMHLK